MEILTFADFLNENEDFHVLWEGEFEGEDVSIVIMDASLIEEAAAPGMADFIKNNKVTKSSVVSFMNRAKANAKQASFKNSPGGFLSNMGRYAMKAAKNHPFIAGAMAAMAVDALVKYQRNKKLTTTFYAKDMKERMVYQKMVDDMVKTGKYRLMRSKYDSGGYMWIVKRKG